MRRSDLVAYAKSCVRHYEDALYREPDLRLDALLNDAIAAYEALHHFDATEAKRAALERTYRTTQQRRLSLFTAISGDHSWDVGALRSMRSLDAQLDAALLALEVFSSAHPEPEPDIVPQRCMDGTMQTQAEAEAHQRLIDAACAGDPGEGNEP